MTQPAPLPPADGIVEVQAGLAETPLGQRVAIVITALLPKDAAEQIAAGITAITGQMSKSGLVVAAPGTVANGRSG